MENIGEKEMRWSRYYFKLLSIFLIGYGLILTPIILRGSGLEASSLPSIMNDTNDTIKNVQESEHNIADTIKVNIQLSHCNMEEIIGGDGLKYQKLSIPESYFYTQEEGSPLIPFVRELIQIPVQALNIELKARYMKNAIEYNDILMYPKPKEIIKETPEGHKYIAEEFYLNKDIYQKNYFIPAEIAEIKQDGYFRSVRMLETFIYPFRYNPKQKILEFYPEIELTISYKTNNEQVLKGNETEHFTQIIKDLVSNPQDDQSLKIRYRDLFLNGNVKFLTDVDLQDINNQIDYLIITHSAFYNCSPLSDFAQYRANYDLFSVGIAKVEDIYVQFPNNSGNDHSIKDFIEYAYCNWQGEPLSYLLLLGDTEWVPTHMDEVYTGAQNDDWFGYVEGDDEWADMAIGRLSIRDPNQIENIKNKIYHYEQDNIIPGDYHEKILVMDAHPCIKDRFFITGYQSSELYSGKDYTEDDFYQVFGSNFIYRKGHGTNGGWAFMGYPIESNGFTFTYNDFDKLKNVYTTPIIMTTSCNTADIYTNCISNNYPGVERNSFGEALVNLRERGAVAYYGATVEVGDSTMNTASTLEEIFDNFEYNLGQAILYGEMKNWPVYSHQQILIGDPALHAFGHRLNSNLPDLTLASNDISYNSREETLSVKISNIGFVNANNVPVEVYIYETSEISHLFAKFNADVPAGSYIEKNLTVSPILPGGTYLFTVKIDPENTISESFKLNNQNGREIDTTFKSIVTFLNGETPLEGALVRAYNDQDMQIAWANTDSQGMAHLSIEKGISVRFEVLHGAGNYTCLAAETDYKTAPYDATLYCPLPSHLVFTNSAEEIENGLSVMISDRTGKKMLGRGETGGEFYLKEDMEVIFELNLNADPWVIKSDVCTTQIDLMFQFIKEDTTPPTTPVVNDEGDSTNSSELTANWHSTDPESWINEYQYAIGTFPEGTDVSDWQSVWKNSSVTKNGLGLSDGQIYYFNVKAKNGAGLWSEIGSSDGIIFFDEGINHAPEIISGPNATPNPLIEDETATLSIVASDVDGDALTYIWVATDGTITGSGESVSYIPPVLSEETEFDITVTVNDGKGGTDTGIVTITVTPIPKNFPPPKNLRIRFVR